MIINQEEYKLLKHEGDKWKWLKKYDDDSVYLYEKNPNGANGKVLMIELKKGLFSDFDNDHSTMYSLSELIEDYENKALDLKMMES